MFYLKIVSVYVVQVVVEVCQVRQLAQVVQHRLELKIGIDYFDVAVEKDVRLAQTVVYQIYAAIKLLVE